MTDNQQVSVHITSGAGEVVRLAATLLLFGGAGSVAWAISHTGYAELAGSGLSVMLVTAGKLAWKRGMIGVPTSANADTFAETRSAMQRITGEWSAWSARASLPAIVAMSFAYAVAFLVLRAGIIKCLTVFQNPWIAGGVGAIAGAFVVMPRLLPSILAAFRNRDAAPAAPPAPTPPIQPTYPAAAAPAPTPAPAPIVMRRKTPKDGSNV